MSSLVMIGRKDISVPIVDGSLLGPKMVAFMEQALDDLGLMGEVSTIFIREKNNLTDIDEAGAILRAMYDPLTKGILISLGEIWDTALTLSQKEERKTLSLRAMCHFLFCLAFLHECYHLQSHGAKGDNWIHDGEEDEAEEFSINWLCDMAKTYDLELPSVEEDGWFGEQASEWYALVHDTDERMIQMHVDMYKNNITWRDLYKDIDLDTIREYYRIIAIDALDNKAWGATKLVSVVQEKSADTETTKPVVPAPPATPKSPVDDMVDDEPAARFMDNDDESGWDDVPWDEEDIATMAPKVVEGHGVKFYPPISDKPANKPVVRDPQSTPVKAPTVDINDQSKIAKEVIHRLFNHMFEKCGWNGNNWDNTHVGNIVEPVFIDDVENVRQVFMGMNGVIDGKFRRNVKITDRIIGDLQLSGTPKYELFLNANGKRVKRVIAPVNMKIQSDSAREMKEGKWVAWLMDGYKPATEDSILFRLRFDPETDTQVEWTRWPEEQKG